ncbi:MAG TPA: zinc ABC transporter substrate-binding protein [Burkholderiales bacterium]|nr:zinc ABC transporter substrate-binding protein [Burkholderiales bacterium]
MNPPTVAIAAARIRRALLFGILALLYSQGAIAHRIVACEPEWAALAKELGGDAVIVESATTGLQDPHRLEARPRLIAMVRNADLLVCTGMEVEAGWLPILLSRSGNPKIQPGRAGFLAAGDYVRKLDVPTSLDRAQGDVHPSGNHHIQNDPYNILLIADALAERLAEIDPPHGAHYEARRKAFSARWNEAIRRWEKQAAPLRGLAIVEHHKAWTYLCRWLGMREIATLEPRPGIEPTVAHLREVLATVQREPANAIVLAPYNYFDAADWLAERTKIPVVVLPTTVGGTAEAKDLFGLFDDTIQRLLAATRRSIPGGKHES